MAEVFKARVTGAGGFERDVVLKRLLSANDGDAEFVNMFTDEACILGALNHQNVVQALDFGQEDDKHFLVLEYVEGPSLGRVLRNGRPVSPAVVAYIGRELCRALDYVHRFEDADGTSLGLVHRDVTPSNVIVTPAGGVKLLDFGIAKFAKATQSTRAGTVKGKTSYLAPEQLDAGETIDGRVDLFALGTVLHELLSGARLFAGDNDLSTIRRIMELKIPTPSSLRPGVPPALDRVVMRALERDPAARYASAAEMGRDLDAVVVSTRLQLDEVTAFVRDAESEPTVGEPGALVVPAGRAPTPVPTTREHEAPTRRDLRLPVRMWMGAVPTRGRNAVLAAGLALALAAGGVVGWGGKRPAADAEAEHARPSLRECQAAGFGSPSAPMASSYEAAP